MSTKLIRNAADLVRFKTALKVECGRCGNAVTLSGFEVASVAGTGEFNRIARRFKCSLCGAREARLTVISPPAPRG